MQIDWFSFTPGPAIVGGMILGVAAALYVFFHGRILGIAGIVSGLLHPKEGDWNWRFALILGILSAPFWALLLMDMHPLQVIDASWSTLVIAGLLVGFGSQYGSGCTSSHGICGLSRLSPRSLVATISFMGAGFIVIFVMRHILGV